MEDEKIYALIKAFDNCDSSKRSCKGCSLYEAKYIYDSDDGNLYRTAVCSMIYGALSEAKKYMEMKHGN